MRIVYAPASLLFWHKSNWKSRRDTNKTIDLFTQELINMNTNIVIDIWIDPPSSNNQLNVAVSNFKYSMWSNVFSYSLSLIKDISSFQKWSPIIIPDSMAPINNTVAYKWFKCSSKSGQNDENWNKVATQESFWLTALTAHTNGALLWRSNRTSCWLHQISAFIQSISEENVFSYRNVWPIIIAFQRPVMNGMVTQLQKGPRQKC